MPSVSLKAHFDGERIVLDEPFELVPDSLLLVTILPEAEHSEWAALATESLARAYSEDEPEYTSADLRQQ